MGKSYFRENQKYIAQLTIIQKKLMKRKICCCLPVHQSHFKPTKNNVQARFLCCIGVISLTLDYRLTKSACYRFGLRKKVYLRDAFNVLRRSLKTTTKMHSWLLWKKKNERFTCGLRSRSSYVLGCILMPDEFRSVRYPLQSYLSLFVVGWRDTTARVRSWWQAKPACDFVSQIKVFLGADSGSR